MQGFFINIDVKLGLKAEVSFEAGGQTADMKADGCFEGVWIDTAALSFDEGHFTQNLVGTDRVIEDNCGIAAEDKSERFTCRAILRIFKSATRTRFASLNDSHYSVSNHA
jgi:hypothetical protein